MRKYTESSKNRFSIHSLRVSCRNHISLSGNPVHKIRKPPLKAATSIFPDLGRKARQIHGPEKMSRQKRVEARTKQTGEKKRMKLKNRARRVPRVTNVLQYVERTTAAGHGIVEITMNPNSFGLLVTRLAKRTYRLRNIMHQRTSSTMGHRVILRTVSGARSLCRCDAIPLPPFRFPLDRLVEDQGHSLFPWSDHSRAFISMGQCNRFVAYINLVITI